MPTYYSHITSTGLENSATLAVEVETAHTKRNHQVGKGDQQVGKGDQQVGKGDPHVGKGTKKGLQTHPHHIMKEVNMKN